ncbi:MAG: translocation/assembly module TamB [Bacteroidales bacterium]|nr:translocation/assembly module TamB [Bacteroidales bacterium]
MQKQVFHIEKIRKITLYGILLIVFLLSSLMLLLQTSYIQTKITQFIIRELSAKLNADINIDNVKISLFRGFVFNGINIQDQQNDTLLSVKELSVIPAGLQINFEDISLKEIIIDDLFLNLYETNIDTLNLQYILDALKSDKETDTSQNFKISSKTTVINNSCFSYRKIDTVIVKDFNYKNMRLDSFSLKVNDLLINNDDITAQIEKLSFKDKSGFIINNFQSQKININPEHIRLKKLFVKTNNSQLNFDSLNIDYPKGYKFDNFLTEADVDILINKSSYISYKDVKFFITDTADYTEKLYISAHIRGSPNNFSVKNLELNYEELFNLKMDAKVRDLPAFKDPYFNISIIKLSTDVKKIKALKIPGKDELLANIPEEFHKIETINYSGKTKGRFSRFISKGEISGNFGTININALAKNDSLSGINIEGELSGKELDIAKTFDNNDLGKLTFNQNIDFSYSKSKKIKIKTFGKVDEFTYKNYTYRDIDLYAELLDKKVDSLSVKIDQKEIKAEIIGNIEFIPGMPEFNITVDIDRADLKRLNLDSAENRSTISLKLQAFFNGLNIDDFTGVISLKEPLNYTKDSVSISVNELILRGYTLKVNHEETKKITLDSDIGDMQIISKGKTSKTFASLKSLVTNIFKAEENETADEIDTTQTGYVDFEVNLKNPKIITSLFLPEVEIAKDTKIYGYYHPQKHNLYLSLNALIFNYKNVTVNDFYIIAYTKNRKLFAGTGGSSLIPNESFLFENINLEGDFQNDTVNFNLIWDNFKDSANYAADISGLINLKKNNNKTSYQCSFSNSEIIINDIPWFFSKSIITIDSTHINISDLSFKNKVEEIYIDGNISNYPGDILYTEFKNFSLENLSPITPGKLKLYGKLSGSATLAHLYETPLIFTRDSIADLKINDIDFGNLYITSHWDNIGNKIHVNAYNLKGEKRQFMNDTIYGDYWPEKDSISFIADIRSMTLKTLEHYYEDYVGFNRTAFVTGKILINGYLKEPSLTGDLKLKQTTAHIKYLNTTNNIQEMDIHFDNEIITFSETKLLSGKFGSALLKGNIRHNNFSNFILGIDLDADNFMLSDIIPTDSSFFYGKAFGTGNIRISGPLEDLKLVADITTNKNTEIFIPVSSNETFEEENSFIKFITDTTVKEKITIQEQYAVEYGGFSMNVKLNVTPDAAIQIIFNESTGDLFTNGEGNLNLTLNREGDFNMFGNYIISEGRYNFNIKEYKKDFIIEEGGSLNWYGNPEDATIDIKAVNKLYNVALKDLGLILDETKKTDAACYIHMTGRLLNPELKLYAEILDDHPEYIQNLNALGENDMNEQFLFLLIFRKFRPLPGMEGSGPQADVGELLTEQFNSLLKNTGVGVGYESGDELLTDKYIVKYDQAVLDGRIVFKGEFGMGGANTNIEPGTNPANNYVGEVEVEAKLNRKGTVRAKVYNKANDQIENEGDYIQGMGFVWRKKFNTLKIWGREEEKDSIKTKRFIKKIKNQNP